MTPRQKQSGFTLVEMLVVISIITLLVALAVPAVSTIQKSHREIAGRNLIRSQLWLAQAHAASVQKYSGLRFQFDREGALNGRQYLVQIEKAGPGSYYHEYNAVADTRPVGLPQSTCVISLNANYDAALDDNNSSWEGLNGATTFSIIFSPTGQMVIKDVTIYWLGLDDRIFGSEIAVNSSLIPGNPPPPLLFHDQHWTGAGAVDNGPLWCEDEPSATGFYLAETGVLQGVDPDRRFTDYVGGLKPELINTYTGQLIEEDFN